MTAKNEMVTSFGACLLLAGRLCPSSKKFRQAREDLPGKKTLAYFAPLSVTKSI